MGSGGWGREWVVRVAPGAPGVKKKNAPGIPAVPPWSPHLVCLPITGDSMELPVVLSSSRNWAGLPCILLPWATVSHLFSSPHPSQVQTQWHIFVWRSFVQVLACCRFDPKCKPVFFFFFFLLREAQHLFPFSSPTQIPSCKLSPGFASAALCLCPQHISFLNQ